MFILQNDKKREDVLKPTNPAAQKAALAGTSQYKVSPRPTAKIKPKPIQSLVNGKVRNLTLLARLSPKQFQLLDIARLLNLSDELFMRCFIKVSTAVIPVTLQSQLFDGLDDDDSSFGNDTFVPRKSVKKLVIRNSNRSLDQSSSSMNRSQLDDSLVSPVDVPSNIIANGSDR